MNRAGGVLHQKPSNAHIFGTATKPPSTWLGLRFSRISRIDPLTSVYVTLCQRLSENVNTKRAVHFKGGVYPLVYPLEVPRFVFTFSVLTESPCRFLKKLAIVPASSLRALEELDDRLQVGERRHGVA
jgi:hypothetical protein